MFSWLNCIPRRLNNISLLCKPSSLYIAAKMSTWGYTDKNGPATWANIPGIKTGNRQSPIDIIPAKCCVESSLKNLQYSYPSFENATLQNNGGTVMFAPSEAGNTSAVSSGPLSHKYKLAQFHFHWGKHDGVGSEHTVDGVPFAGELHLVHYNTGLYGSAKEALTAKDGLTVLGMFLKVGDQENALLKKITDKIPELHKCGSSVTLDKPFNPLGLIPAGLEYWTYPGSLTTPPLSESVTWVVFKDPLIVSSAQMAAFREIQSGDGHCLCENFRPTQPLNGRVVKASFKCC